MQTIQPDAGAYFMGPHGEKYFFADLCKRIHKHHPEVLGEHVSVQLEALGLLKAAQQGETPCSLPFTFADAA